MEAMIAKAARRGQAVDCLERRRDVVDPRAEVDPFAPRDVTRP
jgi:hypothetical protein